MNVSMQYYGFESIDYARDKVDKYVPTVFIGLGGTGKNTLLRFRKNLLEEYGAQWRADFARFLVIDTDDQKVSDEFVQVDLRPERGEFISCNFTDESYHLAMRSFRQRADRRFTPWMHPDFDNLVPRSAVQQGAGTFRQAGRLAFFLKYSFIADQILQHLRGVMAFAAGRPQQLFGRPGEVYNDRLEVVIVTSLAGGTGSGMFLDIAYLIRHLIESNSDFKVLTTHTTLIGLLPSAFCKVSPNLEKRFQQNAYAALLEMEHYNTPRQIDPFGRIKEGRGGRRRERPVFRVNWTDSTGREMQIASKPWDTCYLIDDVTDLQRLKPSSLEDIYQMVADYLFLDFGNNPFAIAKRSARSNHSQLIDRTVGEQVIAAETFDLGISRSGDNARGEDPPKILFENFYGCTYSSFGLSEIFIDMDRLVRATSFRLAARLLRERWLGRRESLQDAAYLGLVQDDLKGGAIPTGESVAVDLNIDALEERLARPTEKDLRQYVRDEFVSLSRNTKTEELPQELERLLGRLNRLSSPTERGGGGEDYQLVVAGARNLIGSLPDLGPLRKRLAALMRDRSDSTGLAVTLRYLEELHTQLDRCARYCHENAVRSAVSESGLFDRLDDAALVGWPCRSSAVKIEFRRVLDSAESLAWRRYRKRILEQLERVYGVLREFVGSPKQLQLDGGDPTLWRRCQVQIEFVERLEKMTTDRFEQVAQFRGNERKQSLIPALDVAANFYDRLIENSLVHHPAIGERKSEIPPGTSSLVRFDWPQAEREILGQVLGRDGQRGGMSRMDVVDMWTEDYRINKDRTHAIVEVLADSCRRVIEKSLKLDELASGSAVNYIKGVEGEATRKTQRVIDLVQASSTHLPLRGETMRYRPAFRNLLGLSLGEDDRTTANSKELETEIRNTVETQRGVDPAQNVLHESKSFIPSRIVLVRELAGVPLHVYDRLHELGEAYFHPSVAQQRLTTHLRWSEGFEDLPDIEPIGSSEFESIQKHVLDVLRSILLEFVLYQGDRNEGRFVVEISDTRRSNTTTHNLGSRLPRVLQHASTKSAITDFLGRQWQDWLGKVQAGQPVYLALFYCAIQRTLSEFPQEVDFREQSTPLPLQTCLEYLLDSVEGQLRSAGPEGVSFHEQLRWRSEMDVDHREWRAWYQGLCRKLSDEAPDGLSIVVRLSDHLPFHVVRWRMLQQNTLLHKQDEPKKVDPGKLGFGYPG